MKILELCDLVFYQKHGIYSLEKQIDQKFIVDIRLELDWSEARKIELSETIDYMAVYHVIKSEIAIHEELIENLTLRICQALLENFNKIKQVKCKIRKWPFLDGQGFVAVEYSTSRI